MIAMMTRSSISVNALSFVIRHSSFVIFSSPFRHLFWKRAMRAIGIVLQTKIFVDLQERLLMRDCSGEFAPAWIVTEKSRSRGFESAIAQTCRQFRVFGPKTCPERSRRIRNLHIPKGKITFAKMSAIRALPTSAIGSGEGFALSV